MIKDFEEIQSNLEILKSMLEAKNAPNFDGEVQTKLRPCIRTLLNVACPFETFYEAHTVKTLASAGTSSHFH